MDPEWFVIATLWVGTVLGLGGDRLRNTVIAQVWDGIRSLIVALTPPPLRHRPVPLALTADAQTADEAAAEHDALMLVWEETYAAEDDLGLPPLGDLSGEPWNEPTRAEVAAWRRGKTSGRMTVVDDATWAARNLSVFTLTPRPAPFPPMLTPGDDPVQARAVIDEVTQRHAKFGEDMLSGARESASSMIVSAEQHDHFKAGLLWLNEAKAVLHAIEHPLPDPEPEVAALARDAAAHRDPPGTVYYDDAASAVRVVADPDGAGNDVLLRAMQEAVFNTLVPLAPPDRFVHFAIPDPVTGEHLGCIEHDTVAGLSTTADPDHECTPDGEPE